MQSCNSLVMLRDTAWSIFERDGLTPEVFFTFAQQLLERGSDCPSIHADRAMKELQLSNYLRTNDTTTKSLRALVQHWSNDNDMENACLQVAALRRSGATSAVLDKLATENKPTTFESMIDRIVAAQMDEFRHGKMPVTDAYFPAISGHHRVNISWKIIARAPQMKSRVEESLQSYLHDLAAGDGRWCINDQPQGPSTLAALYPGGRRKVSKIAELIKQDASMMEVSDCVLGVRGYEEFTAKEFLLDMVEVTAWKPPDLQTFHGLGKGSSPMLEMMRGLEKKTVYDRLEELWKLQGQTTCCFKPPMPLTMSAIAFLLCELRKYLNYHHGIPARLRANVKSWKKDGRGYALAMENIPSDDSLEEFNENDSSWIASYHNNLGKSAYEELQKRAKHRAGSFRKNLSRSGNSQRKKKQTVCLLYLKQKYYPLNSWALDHGFASSKSPRYKFFKQRLKKCPLRYRLKRVGIKSLTSLPRGLTVSEKAGLADVAGRPDFRRADLILKRGISTIYAEDFLLDLQKQYDLSL